MRTGIVAAELLELPAGSKEPISVRTRNLPLAHNALDVAIAAIAGGAAVCVLFPIYLITRATRIILRRSKPTNTAECSADS